MNALISKAVSKTMMEMSPNVITQLVVDAKERSKKNRMVHSTLVVLLNVLPIGHARQREHGMEALTDASYQEAVNVESSSGNKERI